MAPSPPTSYSSLNYKEITITNVPESSSTVTKVVVVAFNRPHKYNAFTGNMVEEFESAFTLLGSDPRVRAIVLTGNGKAFCAGADLEAGFTGLLKYKESEEAINSYRDGGGRVALAITRCPKPTIAAVNGPAAGVGVTLALPTTIRVAWSGAKLAIPFSRRGVALESCSAFFLPRLIGLSKAMHIATTGGTYLADDPLVSGLFSKLLPTPEETVKYALEVADDIAENTSAVSTQINRDLMVYCPPTPEETHLLDSKAFLYLVGSEDNTEGVNSFMEKRKAEFSGVMKVEDFPFWPWWDSKGVSKPKL